MMRWGRWAGAVFLALGFLGGAQASRKPSTSTTGPTISPPMHPRFEKETGIKVHYDIYDQNEMLEAKLLAGHSGYDVVVPSAAPYLARQAASGVYRKIDKAALKNYGNLDPQILRRGVQRRSRQPIRRALYVGHDRLRLQPRDR